MSSKKHQENVKRIIGIKDDQESLGKLDPKAPIKGRRGIAYFTSSGNLSHSSGETGAGVPVGGVSMNTYTETSWDFDLVPVPPTNTLPPGGTPTKTVEGSCLNAQPDQNCPKLMDGATTLGGLEGLSDCTTGTPIDMNLLNDTCTPPVTKCDCVDVCVEEVPEPTYISGFYYFEPNISPFRWQTLTDAQAAIDAYQIPREGNWYGLYCGWEQTNSTTWELKYSEPEIGCGAPVGALNTISLYDCISVPWGGCYPDPIPTICNAIEEQCTEYQWDTCNCYHVEKRGGLKAGWDSVECWREASGCVNDDSYSLNDYWYASYISGRVHKGHTVNEAFNSLASIFPYSQFVNGWKVFENPRMVKDTDTRYIVYVDRTPYNADPDQGGVPNGSPTILESDITRNGTCGDSFWNCPNPPSPDENNIVVVCQTEAQCCENSETDPAAEDCNPLTLLQPQDCCAPDCDNRDWDAEDCWKEGVNCVDDYYQAGYFWVNNFDNQCADTPHKAAELTLTGPYGSVLDYICEFNYTQGAASASFKVMTNGSGNPANTCHGPFSLYRYNCVDAGSFGYTCGSTGSTHTYCDQDPQCCKPDGQGGEICTQPKNCQWDSDGKVEYFFDRETGQYKVHPNDPDASLEDQQPKYPQQMNICDSFGKRIDEFTGKDNTRILVYDNAASGGIMYIIRDSDGKIISAGDSTNIDLYKDPDDPFNWG